jgi:hypothetical protein
MAYLITALLLILRLTLGFDDLPRTVPSGNHVDGNIATLTSDIRIDGEVSGDVTTWTGTIVVSGRIHGDVVSYTGEIILNPGAQIDGNAMSLGGRVQATDAKLAGRTIVGGVGGQYLSQLVGIFAPAPYDSINTRGIAGWPFSLALGLLLFILCLLLIGVWPHRTATTAIILVAHPVAATMIGLLASVALSTLLPLLAMLLAITLIGLPVSVLIVLLANLPYISGLVALIQAARASIEPQTIALTRASILVAGMLILPIALVGMLSPIAALLLFYLIASPGLGALLISRMGTLRSIATQ